MPSASENDVTPPTLVFVAASKASPESAVKAKLCDWVGSGGLVVLTILTVPQLDSGIAVGVIQSFGSEVMLVDERLCMNTEPNDAHGCAALRLSARETL